jgi:hypothetical protein
VIKSRTRRLAGHVTNIREIKTPKFGPKTSWEETTWETKVQMKDNIKIYIREIRCKGVGCIKLAQDRFQWLPFVNMVRNLQVPCMQGTNNGIYSNIICLVNHLNITTKCRMR